MRVHPSILAPRGKSWHYPAAIAFLLFILIITVTRGPREVVVAAPVPMAEKRLDVLVAREGIQPGQPLEKAAIVLDQRPVNTLPADAITNFDAIKGKVAAGPIPAGYPLAQALLADPVAAIPLADDKKAEIIEDPIETLLKEIEQETVAVPVVFSANSPVRGTRIALTLSNPRGQPVVVIEDCWVSKASGREAVLRLESQQALLLQSAKNYGSFNFIEIPTEGESPYAGKGIGSQEQLVKIVEGDKPAADKDKRRGKRIKGYAWVTGEGTKYGIDDEGEIKVVRPDDQRTDQQ